MIQVPLQVDYLLPASTIVVVQDRFGQNLMISSSSCCRIYLVSYLYTHHVGSLFLQNDVVVAGDGVGVAVDRRCHCRDYLVVDGGLQVTVIYDVTAVTKPSYGKMSFARCSSSQFVVCHLMV